MLRLFILISISFLLLKCSQKNRTQKIDNGTCTKVFKSTEAGISLKHSDIWQVYDYKKSNDNAVGVTYYDTLNWDRRYDAQIDIVTGIFNGLDSSQVMGTHYMYFKHLMNTDTMFKLVEDTVAIIDDQKWKKIEYLEYKPDSKPTRNFEYLFYKNRRAVMMSIYIKNGPIENIENELECILNSIKLIE